MKKNDLLLLLLLLLLSIVIIKIIISVAYYNHRYEGCAYDITRLLICYVKENQGKLPETEDDLVRSGYFRKITKNDDIIYEFRYDNNLGENEGWNHLSHMEEFKIYYGVDLNDLEVRNGKLYNKSTNSVFVFFEGPRKYLLPRFYRKMSMEIYNSIKNSRN